MNSLRLPILSSQILSWGIYDYQLVGPLMYNMWFDMQLALVHKWYSPLSVKFPMDWTELTDRKWQHGCPRFPMVIQIYGLSTGNWLHTSIPMNISSEGSRVKSGPITRLNLNSRQSTPLSIMKFNLHRILDLNRLKNNKLNQHLRCLQSTLQPKLSKSW